MKLCVFALVFVIPTSVVADIEGDVVEEAGWAYSGLRQWLEVCKEYHPARIGSQRIDDWQAEVMGDAPYFSSEQWATIHEFRSKLLGMSRFDRVVLCAAEIVDAHKEYDRARRLIKALGSQNELLAPDLNDLFGQLENEELE